MSETDRTTITKLARAAKGGLVSTAIATSVLEQPSNVVASRLSSLVKRGWLARARRGLYVVLPLEAKAGSKVAEDPWILAAMTFSPAYIGGWSAAEHWGLTEQLFRSTLVVTAANIRSTRTQLLGHDFRLFKVPQARMSDSVLVWRGTEKVAVSTPERTIADCLSSPELSGGIRHLSDMLLEYEATSGRDLKKILEVLGRLRNGAALKRFGYLVELLWPDNQELMNDIRKNLTTGYVRLDPTVKGRGKLLSRWRLWINVTLQRQAG